MVLRVNEGEFKKIRSSLASFRHLWQKPFGSFEFGRCSAEVFSGGIFIDCLSLSSALTGCHRINREREIGPSLLMVK